MVSVVIPTYNEEKALPETLQVLFRQPGDYEVIVVDGGSTDRTSAIVSEFALSSQSSALFVFSPPRRVVPYK
jgi:glycosyltransferase involved in cell wall biosynthesis